MNGLLLGIIGGAAAGGTSVLGALTAIFQRNVKIHEERLIEYRMGIIVGFLFMLTAFSYLNPVLEKLYHGGLASDYELWSVVAAFVAGLLMMLLYSEFMQDSLAENDKVRKENILLLLVILLKNIPEGMAAGAAMNIAHSGISYSLLGFIGMHQLFQGVVAAICLKNLGLENELALVGSMFIGFVAVIAGIFGSVMSQQYFMLMPVMMALAGGAMVSMPILRSIEKLKASQRKLELNPGVFSGLIVMLIFIIWKEFV